MKKIAALVPNLIGVAPGQRVRIEAWAQELPRYGWTVELAAFEDKRLREVLYARGNHLTKARRLAACYATQLARVRQGFKCDVLLVHREAAIIGGAWLERLALREDVAFVYDIDDALFLPMQSPSSGWFSLLKFHRKTHFLMRRADMVLAASRTLGEYASKFNSHVCVVPNYIDTQRYRPSSIKKKNNGVRLIWIGSQSTMINLQAISGVLQRFQQQRSDSILHIIGVGEFALEGVRIELEQWAAEIEVRELQRADIALLPVMPHAWQPFKFYVKLVQYMATGLPVIAQRNAATADVIEDGVDGFLVETDAEWLARLQLLAHDADLRCRIGTAARAKVESRYAIENNMGYVASLFDEAVMRHSIFAHNRN